ncbi:MAG TPA: alpha/beta fold hydrolase [Rhizomicrobium sp.]|jgi:pimeloyl-ACP methyl ester carboxylesterase|nr:alpha/beta fold hydrolase [Rhizomicrobium sp.]
MSAFLLVHGAWHGGWCWHKVVARLEAMGHRAAAPDMPGHGDDQTPIAGVTLDHLVDRVCAAIDAAGEKVVLVGHSYGGAMISQAAERRASRIKSLVYLAAFLLGDGQSVTRTARDDKESHLNGKVDFAADDSVATVRPEAIRDCFYGECSEEDVAFARARLRPEAVAGLRTPLRLSEAQFGGLPRTYIECRRDHAISIGMQRRLHGALPCQRVFTLDTDHSPFFSAPDALSEALGRL